MWTTADQTEDVCQEAQSCVHSVFLGFHILLVFFPHFGRSMIVILCGHEYYSRREITSLQYFHILQPAGASPGRRRAGLDGECQRSVYSLCWGNDDEHKPRLQVCGREAIKGPTGLLLRLSEKNTTSVGFLSNWDELVDQNDDPGWIDIVTGGRQLCSVFTEVTRKTPSRKKHFCTDARGSSLTSVWEAKHRLRCLICNEWTLWTVTASFPFGAWSVKKVIYRSISNRNTLLDNIPLCGVAASWRSFAAVNLWTMSRTVWKVKWFHLLYFPAV